MKMQIKLPYGRGYKDFSPDMSRLKAVLVSKAHEYRSEIDEPSLVREALASPINSPRLRELARGKQNIVIISSDHTRPVPSHIITPILLEEIFAGNPDANVTILVATGFHRATTQQELRAKYGDEIVDNVRIHIHDSLKDEMTDLGLLPSGGRLMVNRIAVDADLLLSEGFIEPHFFAGFSGGRKSVLPGVVGYRTVLENHCADFIASPYARAGVLENNPLHKDMLYAAKAANLAFIVNVVIDADKKIIKAFAGHFEDAHVRGCDFMRSLAGVAKAEADIVVTTNGGYPLDQNIYQAVKGMTAAEATAKEGGVIIVAAECVDGHGGEGFFDTFKNASGPQDIMENILPRRSLETVPDQWESQILARILLRHEVIMVTDAPREMVEAMHMRWASTLEEAMQIAETMIDKKDYDVTVIPDGVSVIVI
ncbi:MAG: nickel-dependent lactate racemase [Clostridiales bacterium]|nr:nickel-dependent lactate racemase [Clostridiales bacterium]